MKDRKNRTGALLLMLGLFSALLLHASRSVAEHETVSDDDGHAKHANRALEEQKPLPGHSIYQLQGAWDKAGGGTMALADLRGHPVVALLFYGSCDYACPVLLHEVERIEKKLSSQERADVKFLLVTFDPERDTLESLTALAQDKGYDLARWNFLHGNAHQVRELAALLGVQYRPTGGGNFSHTLRLSLLDRDGLVVNAADGLKNPHVELMKPLHELLETTQTRRGFFSRIFGH